MDNKPLIGILLILIVHLICGFSLYGQTNDRDSTLHSTTLQEVIVKGNESIQIGNKTLYYPNKELKEAMPIASQLLAGLQIPDLIVNPTTGTIAISNGGTISIRINGRPSSQTDLMTISSKDITKVEYITNPGIRYGDVAAVLDVTVKKRAEGYGLILNILQSSNHGWGDYTGSCRYNVGRSEWRVDYHSNPMWQMECYRNNEEIIDLGDYGIVNREEKGVKTPNRMVTHRTSLQYSYADKSGLLFNLQARLFRRNDRYANIGNITTDFNGIISENKETEIAPFQSWQFDFDVYLHWKINSKNKVYFNVIPTLLSSTSNRIYESNELSLNSKINSTGYIILSEGIWESRLRKGMITGGVREIFQCSTADYLTYKTTFKEENSESHCFIEWSSVVGKFKYTVGIDGSLFSLTTSASKSYFNISPKLYLHYSPIQWGGINLSADAIIINPSLAQLTPITQRIDRFQYSEGNPQLSPYRLYKASLEFDFNIQNVQGKLTVTDNYSHHPIMSGKMLSGDKIFQSYYNAGFHNDFILKGQLRTPIFLPQLTLSVEGGWHRIASKGINYRHIYSQPFVNTQLMFMIGKWWFMAKYNSAYNMLQGEMISNVNNNLLNLGLGYRYKTATFTAGIVNPVGRVSLKSCDLSSVAGYERTYHAASTNCLIWLGVTMNLYKGHHRSSTQKKLDNNTHYETIKNIQK